MRISDWSYDVCSSDLVIVRSPPLCQRSSGRHRPQAFDDALVEPAAHPDIPVVQVDGRVDVARHQPDPVAEPRPRRRGAERQLAVLVGSPHEGGVGARSEEHTSELQSLMRISYAVFCLKKKKNTQHSIQMT